LFGRIDEAQALAAGGLELAGEHVEYASMLGPMLMQVARQLGLREQVRELVEQAPEGPWKDAALAAARRLQPSGDLFAGMGAATLEAESRLCAAEELIGAGRRAEAKPSSGRRSTFYRTVGATRYIQQGETLLSRFPPRRRERLVSLAAVALRGWRC